MKGITFSIKKQEIVGMLGQNGAGKTTTIRLLTGLFPLLQGSTVEILGIDIEKEPVRCKSLLGIVPEMNNAFLDFTVFQNLSFSGRLYGMSKAAIERRGRSLLAQFGLADRVNSLTKALSKGLKQRLNFCMALMHDPPVLILDEPCGGLDPISVKLLREQILQLRSLGKTIVLTTHDMQEAQRICDRVMIIHKGSLLIDESLETVRARLGGAKKITCKLDRDPPAGLESALGAGPRYDGPELMVNGSSCQVITREPLASMSNLHDFFHKTSTVVNDVRMEETSLEDVYCQLIEKEGSKND
ncbi:MAG: ABC transporter ATP-binding protein [Candidatus Lokiarchaeota archaeon]|nr:ABC transporter ATP-binding protein [Candidatus Lokiarchaeota archaeon]